MSLYETTAFLGFGFRLTRISRWEKQADGTHYVKQNIDLGPRANELGEMAIEEMVDEEIENAGAGGLGCQFEVGGDSENREEAPVYVFISESMKSAHAEYSADDELMEPEHLMVKDGWPAQLATFCEKLGIPPQPPKWVLSVRG